MPKIGIGAPSPDKVLTIDYEGYSSSPPANCQYCGRSISVCYYGNKDCDQKRHFSCMGCWTDVGLGVPDPCCLLEVDNEPDTKTT